MTILDDRLSIVVAEGNRLSTTRIILGSLLKNSRFKDHEIVFVGDRIDRPVADWARVGNYKTLREYLSYWIPKFPNFKLIDGDWNREDCDPPGNPRTPVYETLNVGIDAASNDWIMVVGSDEYYCPDWDYNIIKHFGEYNHREHIFIPVWGCLCHPHGDGPNGYDPEYIPDDHLGSLGHCVKYIPRKIWCKQPLRESELNAVAEEVIKERTEKNILAHVEPCGHRWELFYWNHVMHRDVAEAMKKVTVGSGAYGVARTAGPHCEKCRFKTEGGHGSCEGGGYCIREMGTGLDIEFDDLLWIALKIKKVGCLDSIMFHIKSYRHTVGREDSFVFDLGEP